MLDLSPASHFIGPHSELKSIRVVFIQCNEGRDIVRRGIWMYEHPVILQDDARNDTSALDYIIHVRVANQAVNLQAMH
jgi:hypothetical protein